MGLDQNFLRFPVPDPLPPKWSKEAQQLTQLAYFRKSYLLHRIIRDVVGDHVEDDATPVTITREQMNEIAARLSPSYDEYEYDTINNILADYPDDQFFVYLADG